MIRGARTERMNGYAVMQSDISTRDSFPAFSGKFMFFSEQRKKSGGKTSKRITIFLLELKLNNHYRNVTSLKKEIDIKLEAKAKITGMQNQRIRLTFPELGHEQRREAVKI